jgi:hypothetical protein
MQRDEAAYGTPAPYKQPDSMAFDTDAGNAQVDAAQAQRLAGPQPESTLDEAYAGMDARAAAGGYTRGDSITAGLGNQPAAIEATPEMQAQFAPQPTPAPQVAAPAAPAAPVANQTSGFMSLPAGMRQQYAANAARAKASGKAFMSQEDAYKYAVNSPKYQSQLNSGMQSTLPREQPSAALYAQNGSPTTKRAALEQCIEQATSNVTNLRYKAVQAIHELTEYFKQPTAADWADVGKQASFTYGDQAETLLKVATDKAPWLRRPTGRTQPVDWNQAPYTLIKKAIKAATEFSDAEECQSAIIETARNGIETLMQPLRSQPTNIAGLSVWQDQPVKQAVDFSKGLGGSLSDFASEATNTLAPKPVSELVTKRMDELSDVRHEGDLQTVKTQLMLRDLMDDPILRSYQPTEIVDAYNTISDVAPAAAQHRILAKMMMRKYLEQGQSIDPYDVHQLVTTEKNMRQWTPGAAMDRGEKHRIVGGQA